MTRDEIDAICAGLREHHPEFRMPLTWHAIQRVLRRARVRYQRVSLDVPALLLTHAGVSVILLNSDLPARSHTEAMAHEFAHIQLHAGDPAELLFHAWRPDVHDQRELEADYLARCLMVGPGIDVPFPQATSAPRAPRTRKAPPKPRPFVAPFAEPYAHRVRESDRSPHRPEPRYGGRLGETPLQRALRLVRPLARPLPNRPRSDEGTILYERDGKVRFVDQEGMRWTMHDIAYLPERTVIKPGSEVARYRCFVNANGARRLYQFARWERREVAAQHCERQLRDATQLPARPALRRDAAG